MKGKESVKMTRTLKKCQIEHLEIEYIAEVKAKKWKEIIWQRAATEAWRQWEHIFKVLAENNCESSSEYPVKL